MKTHNIQQKIITRANILQITILLLAIMLLAAFQPNKHQVSNNANPDLSVTTKGSTLQAGPLNFDDEPVNSETWRSIHLEIQNTDGSITTIDLLRPLWWLEDFGVEIGGTIPLDMPEMAIKGEAKVLDIGPCEVDSSKVDSNYHIVTGKFTHENTVVLDLYFDNNTEKPLGVTPQHPLWSSTRDTWVEAGSLQIGESVKTKDGIVQLTSRSQRPGKHKVYNLEVHQNHTFYVSDLAILAHNNKAKPGQKKPKKKNKSSRSQRKTQAKNVKLISDLKKANPGLSNKEIAELAKKNLKVPKSPHGYTIKEWKDSQDFIKKFFKDNGIKDTEGFATGSRVTGTTLNPKKPSFGEKIDDFSKRDLDITLVTKQKLTRGQLDKLKKLYKEKFKHPLGIRNVVDTRQLDHLPVYGRMKLGL